MSANHRDARRIRTVPLVFGVIFVALGYAGIVAASDVDDAGIWLWPAALVAVGAGGMTATVRAALVRRRDRTTGEPDGDEAADDPAEPATTAVTSEPDFYDDGDPDATAGVDEAPVDGSPRTLG